jgi:membrane-associated protease RseP (regulator of RpoE activity)
MRPQRPTRLWLHIGLFALTALSALIAGAIFHSKEPFWKDPLLATILDPARWSAGAPYAASVLIILLAHELGHYFACRYYGIPASLPYFLPGLNLLGTFGAFIRIRGIIPSRKALFDVGIAGPIAGFLVSLPFFIIGMAQSEIVRPSDAGDSPFLVGSPLLFQVAVPWFFPDAPPAMVLNLSPLLSAAWVGMLATSLNLLPVGQLDGGHLCYAISRRFHAGMSRVTLIGVILLGAVHKGWLLWAVALLILGERHPPVMDEGEPLSRGRKLLALAALGIFLLSFMPIPIEIN